MNIDKVDQTEITPIGKCSKGHIFASVEAEKSLMCLECLNDINHDDATNSNQEKIENSSKSELNQEKESTVSENQETKLDTTEKEPTAI